MLMFMVAEVPRGCTTFMAAERRHSRPDHLERHHEQEKDQEPAAHCREF
jgi:hypothetical protein